MGSVGWPAWFCARMYDIFKPNYSKALGAAFYSLFGIAKQKQSDLLFNAQLYKLCGLDQVFEVAAHVAAKLAPAFRCLSQ